MGRSCARRSSALRVPHPGRSAGGIELEHYFAKARELPKSARWISRGKDCSLWQARGPAIARQRRHRAEPIENRGYHREREEISRGAKRIRKFRCLPLEVCRRRTNPESLAYPGGRTRAHCRIRRHEPRPVAARIQIRRADDLL